MILNPRRRTLSCEYHTLNLKLHQPAWNALHSNKLVVGGACLCYIVYVVNVLFTVVQWSQNMLATLRGFKGWTNSGHDMKKQKGSKNQSQVNRNCGGLWKTFLYFCLPLVILCPSVVLGNLWGDLTNDCCEHLLYCSQLFMNHSCQGIN